jgi:hypothetical protein
LLCSKAKHRCIGAVWGIGEGTSRDVVRVLLGTASEELREMQAMMKEMMELQKASIKAALWQMREVTGALHDIVESFQYGWDTEWDDEIFEEWLEDIKVGKLEKEVAELRSEEAEFGEWLRERNRERSGLEEVGEEEGGIVVESGAGM